MYTISLSSIEYNDEIYYVSSYGTPYYICETKKEAEIHCNDLNRQALRVIRNLSQFYYNIEDIDIDEDDLKEIFGTNETVKIEYGKLTDNQCDRFFEKSSLKFYFITKVEHIARDFSGEIKI